MVPKLRLLLGALLVVLVATTLAPAAVADPATPAQKDETAGNNIGTNVGNNAAGTSKRWMPKPGGTFNVPRSTLENELRIERQISTAINRAPKGSRIRIAVFSFDRKPVAQALARAHARGVQVQILLNNHQITPAQKILHKALGRNRHKRNFAYECTRGCRSTGENQHIKFYLFSKTGGAKDVVMTGSANLTMNGARNQYNDLYIKNNAPKVYAAFNNLFDSMRKDKPAKPAYWVQNIGKKFQLQATPFRNYGPKNDPIITILNRVRCKGATGGTGNANKRTIVRVSMHTWNEYRGVYLAEKFRQLYTKGCDVKLMYGMAGEKVRNTFAKRTKRGYVLVHTNGADTDDDGKLDLYSHQKYLLISGNYGKDSSTNLVVTGSSNYNNDGLKGDEEIFLIKSDGVFRNYIKNFQWLWEDRSRLVRYIPYSAAQLESDGGTVFPPPTNNTNTGSARRQSGPPAGWDFSEGLATTGPEWEND